MTTSAAGMTEQAGRLIRYMADGLPKAGEEFVFGEDGIRRADRSRIILKALAGKVRILRRGMDYPDGMIGGERGRKMLVRRIKRSRDAALGGLDILFHHLHELPEGLHDHGHLLGGLFSALAAGHDLDAEETPPPCGEPGDA